MGNRWVEIKLGNITFQVPEKKMYLVTDVLPREGKAKFSRIEPPRDFRLPEMKLPEFPWKKK